MIGIVDYGMGNLRSVQKAMQHVGSDAVIVSKSDEIASLDKLILPGVGAFGDAMQHLQQRDLVEPLCSFAKSGKPLLGICLGLQLLFDSSQEDGEHVGLGLLGGNVVRFNATHAAMKIPQMGWNALQISEEQCPLLRGVSDGDHVYFVHSYYAVPTEESHVAATADYGGPFCAVAHAENLYACQFHPEKSQRVGLTMLKNFADL